MCTVPIRRNSIRIDKIITELFSHPFFIPNETIISIGTSSTEPLASGVVLDSTLLIMKTFVKYGLKNPFWIVTKAGLPDDKIEEFAQIAAFGNKIMFSICFAGNPKSIEPAQNDRFRNVEKIHGIKNIYISWYLRPIVDEWCKSKSNLQNMIASIAEKYGNYIDYIVPGGLRWTEGIEYAITEINKIKLPKLQKDDNKKTLSDELVKTINESCEKFFTEKEVFYNSSCALSRMLDKQNINLSQYLKNNCNKSICFCSCNCKNNINKQLDSINYLLYNVGIDCEIKGLDLKNKKLVIKNKNNKIHYVEQQIIKQLTAEYIHAEL